MLNSNKSRLSIRTNLDFRLKYAATKILVMALMLPIMLGIAPPAKAQSDLIITGVIDGPLSGGLPKAVEFFVINNIADLSAYTIEHNLDGFVIEGRSYMLKSSTNYQAYLRMPNSITGPT